MNSVIMQKEIKRNPDGTFVNFNYTEEQKASNRKIYYKRYFEKHHDRIVAYRIKTKKRRSEYLKKYRETHRELKNKLGREYNKRIKLDPVRYARKREVNRAWKKTEKGIKINKVCCANRRVPGSHISKAVLQRVYEDNIKKYGTLTCYLCNNPVVFGKDHIEHKTPICRGGTNEYNNLEVSCVSCNLSKQSMTTEEYKQKMGVK